MILSQEKNLVLGLIQENSMEFLLQTSLPYILQTIVCVYTTTNPTLKSIHFFIRLTCYYYTI